MRECFYVLSKKTLSAGDLSVILLFDVDGRCIRISYSIRKLIHIPYMHEINLCQERSFKNSTILSHRHFATKALIYVPQSSAIFHTAMGLHVLLHLVNNRCVRFASPPTSGQKGVGWCTLGCISIHTPEVDCPTLFCIVQEVHVNRSKLMSIIVTKTRNLYTLVYCYFQAVTASVFRNLPIMTFLALSVYGICANQDHDEHRVFPLP